MERDEKQKQHLDPQATITALINANGHRIRLTDLASHLADLIPVGMPPSLLHNWLYLVNKW